MKDKKVKEQMKSCRSTGDIFCDSMDHSDTHAIKINGYIKKARRSMARLRHLYQKICRLSATTDRRTDAEIWFYSNFYLLDELYRQTYRSLKGKKRARASNKYGESRILTDALCEQLQEKNNYLLTEKTIRSYFEAISETEKLTNSDVLMIPEILILRTVEEIDRSFQNIEGTAESAERVIHCIRSLRAIRDISMEELIQSVSYTEQILLADPGNIYSQCDEKTRAFYRQRVFEYAQKHYISENAAAQYFWDLANRQGKDIGFYLLPRQYHKKQVMYYTSVFGGTLFLTAALFFMFIACNFNMIFSVICTVLAVIPLYEFAKNLTGHIFSKHLSPDILPRLKMESVPDHAKTLVVITTLLCDNKNDQQIFDRLEEYYLGNRDQNVRVGALCDLCDHSNMTSAEDDERILYAKERIAALNRKYGPNFCLFLRRRSYSSNQKRYMGWERKRGALIELVRLIRGRETTFSVVECDRDFLKSVRYVVTLDSDTRLPFASVRELVATMEYPHNRPKIDPEKGIVTEGYGILQPRMMPELTSSRKTRFSMMLTGGGGIDAYSLAAFDLYFHLFGEGIFCGKGIFDVDAFEQCVTDAFPENRVLSHDLLEGTRLRCAIIPDMVFTDGVPSTPMSYFKRQHRWIRGDVQALPFGHRWIESTEKQKQKNPISFLSRYKIKDNIRRSLVPVCSTVLLILGMFLPNRAAALAAIGALLYLVYPALQAFFSCLTHSKISLFRRFFSDVKPVISDIAINLIYSLSSLVYISKLTVDAMVRSFWRMHVSHRNMLEWVTAYEADSHKKSARLQYIRSMWISIVFGAAALIFGASFVKWIGILWIAFPLWCQFLSKGHLEKQGILPNLRQNLAKSIILRAASHQFWEGDVQHWWHNLKAPHGYGHMGIRSRCSDDFLWLPYAVAHYISKTGDLNILDMQIPYIESAVLSKRESERYERPRISNERESLYMHCVRAIEHALCSFGEHGLPLIGSCDWNDGFSRVGIGGKGESVWLGWFLICVLQDFIPICNLRGDTNGVEKYTEMIQKLYLSLEANTYENGWYIRAFFDDGTKLGAASSEECKIDLIPQAFAAISKMPKKSKALSALNAAYDCLYDARHALIRLFWPPFVDGEKDPGYIKAYVAGIRENGGQYTHAANWAAYAYLKLGENARGYELLRAINPLSRLSDPELLEKYGIEPYVIAGDVYANPDHMGRGGWSWYTGGAGWFYRTVLEQLIGYNEQGNRFLLKPHLSAAFSKYSIKIQKHGTVYEIFVHTAAEFSVLIDGIRLPDICSEESLSFEFDGELHKVEIACPLK